MNRIPPAEWRLEQTRRVLERQTQKGPESGGSGAAGGSGVRGFFDRARRAVVGAAQIVSVDELKDQANRITNAILALDTDVKSQFAFKDPAELEATAKKLDAAPWDTGKKEAAELREQAAELRKLTAGKSAGQIAQERGFYKRWADFVERYEAWRKDDLESALKWNTGLVIQWDALEKHAASYQKYWREFKAMGGKPSRDIEDTPEEHKGTNNALGIPRWVWVTGAIVGGVYVLTQVSGIVTAFRGSPGRALNVAGNAGRAACACPTGASYHAKMLASYRGLR